MCNTKEDDERIANDDRLNNTERDLKNELLIKRPTRAGTLTNNDWEQQLKRNQQSIELENKLNKITDSEK